MSGGRKFEAGPSHLVGPAFSGIADELRRQYTLAYYPEPVGSTGERRQIKIRLKLPDTVIREAVVRAKPCYMFQILGKQLDDPYLPGFDRIGEVADLYDGFDFNAGSRMLSNRAA